MALNAQLFHNICRQIHNDSTDLIEAIVDKISAQDESHTDTTSMKYVPSVLKSAVNAVRLITRHEGCRQLFMKVRKHFSAVGLFSRALGRRRKSAVQVTDAGNAAAQHSRAR